MTDQDSKASMQSGFELLCQQSRIIAMLPLEEWHEALNRGETIAAILDPTLFREYRDSEKAKILKSIIEAAIPLKRAVLGAQPAIERMLEVRSET